MTTKTETNTTVYISNLSYKRDRQGIKVLFEPYGKIKAINIIVEPRTGQPRGMAFVEMATVEEAKAAIAGLDGQNVDGRTAKAKWATPLKDTSKGKFFAPKVAEKKKVQKDLQYKDKQIAKKARNEAKRKANPLQFKVAVKKKAAKKT